MSLNQRPSAYATVCLALSGGVWGTCTIGTWGLLAILATGEKQATLPLITGFLCGFLAAVIQTHAPHKKLMFGSLAGLIVFLALSAGAPFNISIADHPFMAGAGALFCVAILALASRSTSRGVNLVEFERYQAEIILIRTLRGAGYIIFSILVFLPFYAMVLASLKTQSAMTANPLDFGIDLSQGLSGLFDSYHELLTTFHFGLYIGVSALVSVVTVIVTLLFSIPGAYAVARLNFPGRAAMARSILLIYMIPAIVLVIPLYAVFSQLGLRDSLIGLMIVYPATTIPVAIYMLQGYFRSIPGELEEAGIMDGLSRPGVIWRITMPLSLPAIASVSLYVFMIAWNEFLFAFMFLDNPEIFTLPRAVVSLNSSEIPRQHLMAGAVIVTVPVLALFLWFERFMVQGLTSGGVKG